MIILHDEGTLKHKTVELLGARLIAALECPERIESIVRTIESDGQHNLTRVVGYAAWEKELFSHTINTTHEDGYLAHLSNAHSTWVKAGHIGEEESLLPECFPTFTMPSENARKLQEPSDIFARSGFYAFDMSTGIMKDTYTSALASAHLAMSAALMAQAGETAVCALCRPPGHHCDTQRAGGYCYLNNAVLATTVILSRLSKGSNRDRDLEVAILDLDMHHGNGTQSFFYNRQVRYVSIHGKDEYPYYSGSVTELGSGLGHNYNHNYPISQQTSESDYLSTLQTALEIALLDSPKYLVISMGFDTYHLDPLGGFALDTGSYANIGKTVAQRLLASGTKAVILLEGGYVIESLGHNLLAFLSAWNQS